MNSKYWMALLCLIFPLLCGAQQVHLPNIDIGNDTETAREMGVLAKEVLQKYAYQHDDKNYQDNMMRLQLIGGEYLNAIATIDTLRSIAKTDGTKYPDLLYTQYKLFAQAKIKQQATNEDFKTVFASGFDALFSKLDEKNALYISTAFLPRTSVANLRADFIRQYKFFNKRASIPVADALTLCRIYVVADVYQQIEAPARQLLKADDDRRYIIQDSVLIKGKGGAVISATVVRPRGVGAKQPAVLFFFIYSNRDRILYEAKSAAMHGYVGVVGDTRGKRLSPNPIEPYEHETEDVNTVIDWISKQPWSNGKVGMYGGSYSGYAQWAATKHLHPALKTIVPYVAATPGQGLPMENNVFLTANYQWAFYVTNNKYVDDAVNDDNARWQRMRNKWYASGAAFNKIDSIDGTPNPWLQKWLKHPSYDKYWQDMVPYKTDFAKINIPVLTFEGYYDDGQISGLSYLMDHYKYNPKANHYLIIGPYDHFGTQQGGVPVLRDYHVDPVALIDTREITFEWMDYILKGGKKPAILKDRINYEVMGANEWRHAPSVAKMANRTLKLYLSEVKPDSNYQLCAIKPAKKASIYQEVDLADRQTSNNDYYPFPIIKKQLDRSNGLFFISKPFYKPVEVNGMFSGELMATINKKDMDIGVVLYEVMPNGDCFELSYFLGRASYAKDNTQRHLLRPGVEETIPFSKTRLVSRQMVKGSRLLVVLNIDKNPFAQINYGTGKDVSAESIKDAKEPLKIKWSNQSFINVPVME